MPRKNLAELGGRPLLAWTLEAAAASRLDHVIVSTDCPEIAETAEAWHTRVVRRHTRYLGAEALPDGQELHALCRLAGLWNKTDVLMRLQPTSPFRRTADINRALSMLDVGASAVISISQTQRHPLLRVDVADDGLLTADPALQTPRQNYTPAWEINGAIYAARIDYYLDHGFYGPDTHGLMMTPESSLDIDSLFDLSLARGVA